MDINVFFSELEKLLKESGLETAVLKGQEPQLGDTLRALLPIDETGSNVLLELMAIPFTEEAHLLQIFTTMIVEIGPGYEALKEMLLEWNLICPLGAYGIYRASRQFYHKYNYLLPVGVPEDEMAAEIFDIISLVRDVIAEVYPDAVRLSGNL